MGLQTACVLLNRTGMVRVDLRRAFGADVADVKCDQNPIGYHTATVTVEEEKARPFVEGEDHWVAAQTRVTDGDPRWPKSCVCGFLFEERGSFHQDVWEIFEGRVMYPPTGEAVPLWRGILKDAPVGAMWDAYWLGEWAKGPDGMRLTVQTPAGPWLIDGPGSDGTMWKRKGAPPLITVEPSIKIGDPVRYHAHLTDGILKEC